MKAQLAESIKDLPTHGRAVQSVFRMSFEVNNTHLAFVEMSTDRHNIEH